MRKALLAILAILALSTPSIAGDVRLSFDGPTTFTDGTPINNLTSFNIYASRASGVYTTPVATVASTNPAPTTTVTYSKLMTMASGTWYFVVTSVVSIHSTTLKLESIYSNEVAKFVVERGSAPTIRDVIQTATIAPTSLVTYSGLAVGSTQLKYMTVRNYTANSVVVTSATSDNSSFLITTTMPITIAANSSKRIGVKAAPTQAGLHIGNISINTASNGFTMPVTMTAQ